MMLWLLLLPPEDHSRLERALGPGFSALVRGPARISAWFRGGGARILNLWETEAENARLREELALIKIEYHQLQELHLRSLKRGTTLEFDKRRYSRLKPVHLLARDPSSWFQTAALDMGSAEGLHPGDGVLNHQGVVGKIVATTASTARTLFITDIRSRLSVRLQRSGVTAILSGNGSSGCRLEYLAGQDDVRVGDLVETAPAGLSFPPGIPVGRVVVVQKIENGLKLRAEVELFAQLAQLRNLYVTGRAR
jgi:rod shape-determining protein MreC